MGQAFVTLPLQGCPKGFIFVGPEFCGLPPKCFPSNEASSVQTNGAACIIGDSVQPAHINQDPSGLCLEPSVIRLGAYSPPYFVEPTQPYITDWGGNQCTPHPSYQPPIAFDLFDLYWLQNLEISTFLTGNADILAGGGDIPVLVVEPCAWNFEYGQNFQSPDEWRHAVGGDGRCWALCDTADLENSFVTNNGRVRGYRTVVHPSAPAEANGYAYIPPGRTPDDVYDYAILECSTGYAHDEKSLSGPPRARCREDGTWVLYQERMSQSTQWIPMLPDEVCTLQTSSSACQEIAPGDSLIALALETSPELQLVQAGSISDVSGWAEARRRYLRSVLDTNSDDSISYTEAVTHLARIKLIPGGAGGDPAYDPRLPLWPTPVVGGRESQSVSIDIIIPAMVEALLRGGGRFLDSPPAWSASSTLSLGVSRLSGDVVIRPSTVLQLQVTGARNLESAAITVVASNKRGRVAFALAGGSALASLLVDADTYIEGGVIALEPSTSAGLQGGGALLYVMDLGRAGMLTGGSQGTSSLELRLFESDLGDFVSSSAFLSTELALAATSVEVSLRPANFAQQQQQQQGVVALGTLTTKTVLRIEMTFGERASAVDVTGSICLVDSGSSLQGACLMSQRELTFSLSKQAFSFSFSLPRRLAGRNLGTIRIEFDGRPDYAQGPGSTRVFVESVRLTNMARSFVTGETFTYSVYESVFHEPSNEELPCAMHDPPGGPDCFEDEVGSSRLAQSLQAETQDGLLGRGLSPATVGLFPQSVATVQAEVDSSKVRSQACPTSWTSIGASCFRVGSLVTQSLAAAAEDCREGHAFAGIALPASEDEALLLDELFRESHPTLRSYWLGLAYSPERESESVGLWRDLSPKGLNLLGTFDVPSYVTGIEPSEVPAPAERCVKRRIGQVVAAEVVHCHESGEVVPAVCELRPGVVLGISPASSTGCPPGWARLPTSRRCVKIINGGGPFGYLDAQAECGRQGGTVAFIPAAEQDLASIRGELVTSFGFDVPGVAWLGGYGSLSPGGESLSALNGLALPLAEQARLGILRSGGAGALDCLAYGTDGAWITHPCDDAIVTSAVCELMCADGTSSYSLEMNRCLSLQEPMSHPEAASSCRSKGGQLLSSASHIAPVYRTYELAHMHFGLRATEDSFPSSSFTIQDSCVSNCNTDNLLERYGLDNVFLLGTKYESPEGLVTFLGGAPAVEAEPISTPVGTMVTSLNVLIDHPGSGLYDAHFSNVRFVIPIPVPSFNAEGASFDAAPASCMTVRVGGLGNIEEFEDRLFYGCTDTTLQSVCVLEPGHGTVPLPGLAASIMCDSGDGQMALGRACVLRAADGAYDACLTLFLPESAEENEALRLLGGGWIAGVPPDHPYSNWADPATQTLASATAAPVEYAWVDAVDGLWRVESGDQSATKPYLCITSSADTASSSPWSSASIRHLGDTTDTLEVGVVHPAAGVVRLLSVRSKLPLLYQDSLTFAGSGNFDVDRRVSPNSKLSLEVMIASKSLGADASVHLRGVEAATANWCGVGFSGICYKSISPSSSFRDAQLECEAVGGLLPILDSSRSLNAYAATPGTEGSWVGVYVNQPVGRALWVDGREAALTPSGVNFACGYLQNGAISLDGDCSTSRSTYCQPFAVDLLAAATSASVRAASLVAISSRYTGNGDLSLQISSVGLGTDARITVRALSVMPEANLRQFSLASNAPCAGSLSPASFSFQKWGVQYSQVCVYVNGILQPLSAGNEVGLGWEYDVGLVGEQSLVCVAALEQDGAQLHPTCIRAIKPSGAVGGADGHAPTSFFARMDAAKSMVSFSFVDMSADVMGYELTRAELGKPGAGGEESLVAALPYPVAGCSRRFSSSSLRDDAKEILDPGKVMRYTLTANVAPGAAAGGGSSETFYDLAIPWASYLMGSVSTVAQTGVADIRVAAYLMNNPSVVFIGFTDSLGEFSLDISANSLGITGRRQKVAVELTKPSCRLRNDCSRTFQGPRALLLTHLETTEMMYIDQSSRTVNGVVRYGSPGGGFPVLDANSFWNCPVANVTVSAIDTTTGEITKAITDESGAYSLTLEDGAVVDVAVDFFGYQVEPRSRRYDSMDAEFALGKAAIFDFELTEMRELTLGVYLPSRLGDFVPAVPPDRYFEAWVENKISRARTCEMYFASAFQTAAVPALDFSLSLSDHLSGTGKYYSDADKESLATSCLQDTEWGTLGRGGCYLEEDVYEFFRARGQLESSFDFLGSEPGAEGIIDFTFHPGFCGFLKEEVFGLMENTNGFENDLGCFPDVQSLADLKSVEYDKDVIMFDIRVREVERLPDSLDGSCRLALRADSYGSGPLVMDASARPRHVPDTTSVVVKDRVSEPTNPCFSVQFGFVETWGDGCELTGPWDRVHSFSVSPGQPERFPPFTRKIDFAIVRDRGKDYSSRAANLEPIDVLVLGLKERPEKLAMVAPLRDPILFLILRDPPGGSSYATWEAGSTVSSDLSFEGMYATGDGNSFGVSGGISVGAEAGAALGGWTALVSASAGAGGGISEEVDVSASRSSSGGYTFDFTFGTGVSTSAEPYLAGTASDVLVGVGLTISKTIADFAEAKSFSSLVSRLEALISEAAAAEPGAPAPPGVQEAIDSYRSSQLVAGTICVDLVPVDTWEPARATTWVLNVISILQQVGELDKQRARVCSDPVSGGNASAQDCPAGLSSAGQLAAIEQEIGYWSSVVRQYASAEQEHVGILDQRSKFAQLMLNATRSWRDESGLQAADLNSNAKNEYDTVDNKQAGAYDASLSDEALKTSASSILGEHEALMQASCDAGQSDACSASHEAQNLKTLLLGGNGDDASWVGLRSTLLSTLGMDQNNGYFDPGSELLGEGALGGEATISGDKSPFAFLKNSGSQYFTFSGGGEEISFTLSFGAGGSRSVSVGTETSYEESASGTQKVELGKGPTRRRLTRSRSAPGASMSPPDPQTTQMETAGMESKWKDKTVGAGAYIEFNEGGGTSLTAIIGSQSGTGSGHEQQVTMTFSDPDSIDFFVVEVSSDAAFGTPYFRTVFGESSCYPEAGTTGHFSDVTAELVAYCGDRNEASGIATEGECKDLDPDSSALFQLTVTNDSPTQITTNYWFELDQENAPTTGCSAADLFFGMTGSQSAPIYRPKIGKSVYWMPLNRAGAACLEYVFQYYFVAECELNGRDESCILPQASELMRDRTNSALPCPSGATDCVVSRDGLNLCRNRSPIVRATGATVGGKVTMSWAADPVPSGVTLESVSDGQVATRTLLQGLVDQLSAGSTCTGRTWCDTDFDGQPDAQDSFPDDPRFCGDSDGDGCDDCSQGPFDPMKDGPDSDSDGICDETDHVPKIQTLSCRAAGADMSVHCTAEFVDGDTPDVHHSASMQWGDGSPERCLIQAASPPTPPSGVGLLWQVDCWHTYVSGGAFTPILTVLDGLPGNNEAIIIANSIIVVDAISGQLLLQAAATSAGGGRRSRELQVSVTQDVEFSCGTAAAQGAPLSCTGSFGDWASLGDESAYAALIDWGDGQHSYSPVTLDEQLLNFYFTVEHTYSCGEQGPVTPGVYIEALNASNSGWVYAPEVTFDLGRSPAITDSIQCSPSPAFKSEEVVCNVRFSDEDDSSDHTVIMDWGDGLETPCSVTYIPVVTGKCRHVFSIVGSFTLDVTVLDRNGNRATASFPNFSVTTGVPPTVLSLTCSPKVSIVGRERITCRVDFTDEDEDDVGSHMALIEWGDGVSSWCKSSTAADGSASCDHAYIAVGSYTPQVELEDKRGNKSFMVVASDAIAVAAPAPVIVDALMCDAPVKPGESVECVTRFTDADSPSGHTALMTWSAGGETSVCEIQEQDDSFFAVSCSHVYAEPGTFEVVFTIADSLGNRDQVTAGVEVRLGSSPAITKYSCSSANLPDETLCRASFLDVDAGAQDIPTALVEWGDDSDPSLCNIANGSEVVCKHFYRAAGHYSTSLSITDAFGLKGEAVASADVTECAMANAKCGGQGWEGPSCCPADYVCTRINSKKSLCRSTCAKPYDQCGGADFIRPSCCTPGYQCVVTNEFYSQCVPDPLYDGRRVAEVEIDDGDSAATAAADDDDIKSTVHIEARTSSSQAKAKNLRGR
jgi:hypothetical protein